MVTTIIQLLIAVILVVLIVQLKKLLKEIKESLYLLNNNLEDVKHVDKKLRKAIWEMTFTGIKIK